MNKWTIPALAILCAATSAIAEPVTKVADDFEQVPWRVGQYSMAAGSTTLDTEHAPDTKTTRSLRILVNFTDAFAGINIEPPEELVVPGELRKVTLSSKLSDKRFGLKMTFRDGWGRDRDWELKTDPDGKWTTQSFTIPGDWPQPLAIVNISTHNWNTRGQTVDLTAWLDDLIVETDLANVDPATGALTTWKPDPAPADPAKSPKQSPRAPLVSVAISTPEAGNVFTTAAPTATVKLRNWKPGALTGTANYELLGNEGQTLDRGEQPVNIDSVGAITLPLKADRFGRYVLKAGVALSDGTKSQQELALAKLPVPHDLSLEQKLASPYGLNYHGGAGLMLSPFRKAGLVWFREYAFQYDWVVRAKGADKSYGGWPHYTKIVKEYENAGAMLLPVLQRSIKAPEVKDGKVVGPIGPDAEFAREVVQLMAAFPQITHWELSNEYDLPAENYKAEEIVNWENYQKYHAVFADAVKLMGGGKWTAVENGRAGVWPGRVADCVKSGYFADIDVINSHHYTGVDAPELNHGNFNTGFGGTAAEAPMLFFDSLREAKKAGQLDGKPRRHWLTEFGWDTKAGHVVSHYEQAVYLPRAWMMTLAAGTEKAFWFFHFDNDVANVFFDGCGLMSHLKEPKLSLSAMAGITWVMPNPKYIGTLDAGENTGGYVFEQDGKLVASLFTLKGDNGPAVQIPAEKTYDYLANPIAAGDVKLTMAPIYAVGLDRSSDWYRQTAYDLESPYMVVVAAGDSAQAMLRIRNNRDTAITGKAQMQLPERWSSAAGSAEFTVPAGETRIVPLSFLVHGGESLGVKDLMLKIAEDKRIKDIRLKVMVQPPIALAVSPIQGRPGQASLIARVANKSQAPRTGEVRLELPSTWKAASTKIAVADLKPGEVREVPLEITWSSNWTPTEKAAVQFMSGNDVQASQPIIPNTYVLHRAPSVKLDGDLSDWPAMTQIPTWMLGSTVGEPNARVLMAWAPEGLYAAVEVKDASMKVTDPKSFWLGEVLEVFVDTADNKEHRTFLPGDHQFWFVPQIAENRVFVGQWKSKDEIADTRYDLSNVKSAAKQQGDGYVMEFLLPAEHLQKYQPKVGSKLGLNINLTAHGERFNREVFWPRAKEWSVNNLPKTWGTVELID